jgi:hypothetical protein
MVTITLFDGAKKGLFLPQAAQCHLLGLCKARPKCGLYILINPSVAPAASSSAFGWKDTFVTGPMRWRNQPPVQCKVSSQQAVTRMRVHAP